MVTLANRNLQAAGLGARAEVLQADATALPFDEAAFDLVISTFSMHHWAALTPAVTELAQVLRPGGRLWIYGLRTMSGDSLAVDEAFDGQPLRRTVAQTGPLLGRLVARWTATRPTTPTRRKQ